MSARRLWLPVMITVLGAVAHPTAAQGVPLETAPSYASPRSFFGELKFGPYRPHIDSEFSGTGPYRRYFGDSSGVMTQYELDYQLFQRFGSLAVGFGLGYWTKSGHAFLCTSGSGASCVPDFEQEGGDSTSLSILPLAFMAVYRFDVLAEHYRIPFVPYAKFGLTCSFWWAEKGNGKVSAATVDGKTVHGRGAQGGLVTTLGAALQLDVLDPGAGHELDASLGINHTYLFWEWVWTGAEGFGSSSALKIGDSNWLAGLAFEF
jgi:hypothetical protein